METLNDVLYFLNKLNFTGYLESDDYEKNNGVREIIVDQFQDVNSLKLIDASSIVDDLLIIFMTGELQQIFDETKTLREDIFKLIKEETEIEYECKYNYPYVCTSTL